MEASGATAGEAGGEQGGEQQGQEAQGGVDLSPILDRMTDFESRFDGLEQRLPSQDEDGDEGEPEGQLYVHPVTGDIVDETGQPVDPGEYGDMGYGDEGVGPEQFQAALQQQEQKLRQEYDQKLQQQLAPLQERFQDMDLGALEQRYPGLRDHDTAESTLQAAQATAERLADGDESRVAKMVTNPQFLETVHLAELAREKGLAEVPADPESQYDLEQPGAHQGQGEEDEADRIMAARSGRSFWT